MRIYIVKRLNCSGSGYHYFHSIVDDRKELYHAIITVKMINDKFNEYRQDYTLVEVYFINKGMISKASRAIKEMVELGLSQFGPECVWGLEGKSIDV